MDPPCGRPTRRALSPPTAARSSRARRRSETHRVSPSRFFAQARCTGRARRRSGTCSSPPRGASCRFSQAERPASRWPTSATWPGPSLARWKGERRDVLRGAPRNPRILRHRRDARDPSLEASLARSGPRGGNPGSRLPRRCAFDVRKGPSGLQWGQGKRAAPERVDLRCVGLTSGAGSAISNRFCDGCPAYLGVVSPARVDLGPRW